jgi:hypothetical protein
MDNPTGCPRAHPQAVGCPQAPQGLTTTFEERQERNSKALHRTPASGPTSSSQRRCSTRPNQPHHYNLLRATQHPIGIGHVPEITGHVRRNTQLSKNHGAAAEATLLDRLRKSLDDRGTLDVLRHGVELLGLRQPVALAQFKPALAMNPETLARYGANRLRVVRQLRYSLHHENAIDLVLFLNGLPVATAEL